MSILQAWLVAGIPGLVVAFALFYGRSRVRALLGYVVLLVAFGAMLFVDRASAAAIGGFGALLYAAGRGGDADAETVDTSRIAVPDTVRRTAKHRTG